jgi:hypothetical protein
MTFLFAPRVSTGALALLAGVLAGLAASSPAPALVEKVMTVCSGQLCPFFRPVFAVPDGWWEDGKTGLRLGVRLFVPVGETFDSAPAVIYASARQAHEGENLAAAIEQHHETWRRKVPEVAITRLGDIRRGDGAAFQQHEFVSPKLTQPYERVATATDRDLEGAAFVVRVVLTAKSEASLKAAEESFLAILKSY